MVTKLKEEEKVDILFVVTHIGISKQFDLANHPALAQVDYVLGNDTHERIRKPLQAGHAKVTEPVHSHHLLEKWFLPFKMVKSLMRNMT